MLLLTIFNGALTVAMKLHDLEFSAFVIIVAISLQLSQKK